MELQNQAQQDEIESLCQKIENERYIYQTQTTEHARKDAELKEFFEQCIYEAKKQIAQRKLNQKANNTLQRRNPNQKKLIGLTPDLTPSSKGQSYYTPNRPETAANTLLSLSNIQVKKALF